MIANGTNFYLKPPNLTSKNWFAEKGSVTGIEKFLYVAPGEFL